MPNIAMAVTNLRVVREGRGLTQLDLAQELGISVATYAPIERGVMVPTARLRAMLEEHLGISADLLLAKVQPPKGAQRGRAGSERAVMPA